MDKPLIDALAERVERLEHENRRLAHAHGSQGRLSAAVACYAVLVTVGVILGFRPMVAQNSKSVTPAPKPPDFMPEPPPLDPHPIYPHLEIKNIETEGFALRSQEGNCLVVLSASDGTPTMSMNGKDQKSRLWLRVNQDGEPSLVFFDREGKAPVELRVVRDGEPRIRLRQYTPPPIRPIGPPLPPATTP